ncbi:MAG: Unknown protein [uncultured Campylobacterales bacterium]|uniref:Uncharacterized protein n=1 Tax=uncultured Campylobacterales bacterium TaxID=352960 RepID=A0A6S6SIA5_9BACT|nr:MAG: Unknown protein [uncultured Campylobacterales bacterium]
MENVLTLNFKGILSGVAFVKAGEFKNDETGEVVPYKDSIKLNFTYNKKVIVDDMETIASNTFTVKVPMLGADLKTAVGKYNALIGKTITFPLTNFEKYNFKADLNSIQSIK